MLQSERQRSLREDNIESRRQRILEAARGLIAGGGMQSLSMRKLAVESGLAVTTLYNLYGSRDDILFALVQDAIDRENQPDAVERQADRPEYNDHHHRTRVRNPRGADAGEQGCDRHDHLLANGQVNVRRDLGDEQDSHHFVKRGSVHVDRRAERQHE